MKHNEIVKEYKWLGKVVNIWDVEKYQIIEYKEKDCDTKKITDKSLFACILDDKIIRHSWSSLEAALIFAVCSQYGNKQSGILTNAIIKMIQ